MRYRFFGMACLFGASAATASPWYVVADAGAIFRLDQQRQTTISGTELVAVPGFYSPLTGITRAPETVPLFISGPVLNRFHYAPGPIVSVAVGYRVGQHFRIEAEGGYGYNRLVSERPLSLDGALAGLDGRRISTLSGGSRDSFTTSLAAFLDLSSGKRLVPYVGGGGGINVNDDGLTVLLTPNGPFQRLTTRPDRSAVAGQAFAEAGVAYTFAPGWAAVPSYRFKHVFTVGNAVPNESHAARLGVRHSF